MACIDDIAKAAAGILTQAEVRALEKELARRARNYNGAEGLDKFLLTEAKNIIANIKKAAIIEKRNRGINIIIRKNILEFIENFEGDAAEGLEAYLVGVVGKKPGSRSSVDARQKGIESELMGDLISQLREKNLLPFLNSRSLDLDIAKEMWALDEGKGSVTGSKEAFEIAEIFHRTQKAAVQIQNDLGAWIEAIPGYIARQSHNSALIRKAGIDEYLSDLGKWIDEDATLKGQDPQEFFTQVYNNLVSGIHFKAEGGGADFLGFRGPANIAKKASQERVLHFKDAQAWFEYNEKYGTGNLTESILFGIKRAADNAGLMEGLGTNPRAMLLDIKERLQRKHQDNPDTVKALDAKRFEWFMDELDGTINQPGSVKWAGIWSGVRAVQSMSKLGGVLVSSFVDVVLKVAGLNRNGVGFLDGYKQALDSIVQGRRAGEQRQIADLLGEGFDGMLGQVLSRFSAQDMIPGVMSKLVQRFFKVTGLNWWTDAHKTGAALMLSRNLADNRHLAWGDLSTELRKNLGLYFDESTWDLIRSAALRESEGKVYMTPDSIKDIPDETLINAFGEMSDRQLRLKRQELEIDLRSYITDQTDFAVLTPDAKIRALSKGGAQPGTRVGEVMRLFMQFKSFPMTFVQRGLGQFFDDNKQFLKQLKDGRADVLGLVHLMIGTTVLGYMAMSIKDISKNRTPRDPQSAKTWAAAFVQGGGLGIYGDFFFGEASRYGKSSLETLAGPTFGTLSSIHNVFKNATGLEVINRGKKVASGAFNTIRNHIPFQNLFYTRAATDYLIFNRINEAINPGYMERMKRRIRKNGQEQFIGGN